jgi:hypothetical protein
MGRARFRQIALGMNRAEFLASTAAVITGAYIPYVPQVAGGRTFIQTFDSAPYPHTSRANGHTYQGKLYDAATHYSNSNVAIFVPDGWHPENGAIDAIVHFYGWNHDIAAALSTYRLREQLIQSKRNAILIVPEGPTNAPDSGDGKLELDEHGFARFINDVFTWLQGSKISPVNTPGRIALSAHSGGYGGAGGVLTRGGLNDHITDVLLFDSAYGYFDAFASWARGTNNHLLSVFTADTITGNVALMGMLQAPSPNLYVRLAKDLTLDRLQTRNATFILTTDVAHDDLLTHDSWYTLFLESTALKSTE